MAAADLYAQMSGHGGQRVKGPLQRPGLILRGQLSAGLHGKPTRSWLLDQADDPRAFGLGDPPFAALPAQILQPLPAQAVEAVQPAEDRSLVAPQLLRDGWQGLSLESWTPFAMRQRSA